MHCDEDQAVELANRINELMRSLPPETQPWTVLTGLGAVTARLISSLREEDRESAFTQTMALIREHSGLAPRN